MARTPVDIKHNTEQHRVEAVLEDGTVAGFAEYRDGSGSTYTFTHTQVGDDYEGQGIGGQLASGVMAFAREHEAKIVPSCTFIRSYMARHEETHELLAPGASLEPDQDESTG